MKYDKKIYQCPYCSCKNIDIIDFKHPSNITLYYVTCCKCHASGPECTTKTEAIEHWNSALRRSQSPC